MFVGKCKKHKDDNDKLSNQVNNWIDDKASKLGESPDMNKPTDNISLPCLSSGYSQSKTRQHLPFMYTHAEKKINKPSKSIAHPQLNANKLAIGLQSDDIIIPV